MTSRGRVHAPRRAHSQRGGIRRRGLERIRGNGETTRSGLVPRRRFGPSPQEEEETRFGAALALAPLPIGALAFDVESTIARVPRRWT